MAATAILALHALHHWSWPLIVLTAFLHTTFFGHYGSAAHHELAHKTVFKTRWLNELFYGIACLLNWKNGVHMRHSHGAHHRYTTQHEHEMEVESCPATRCAGRTWSGCLPSTFPGSTAS